jgi:hypothetical protein
LEYKKKIREMIDKSLAIPDLEVKHLELGKIYAPRNEDADEDGYIYYEDLIYYPLFEKQHLIPRSDVGHKDQDGNIIKDVGFLFHDDELVFGRFKPEFGYKFSKPEVEPLPGGVVDIIHTYGIKDVRINDYRYSSPRTQNRDTYRFVHLIEEGHYIQVPKKGELMELYQKKKEKGEVVKKELAKFLNIYRMRIYNSFFKRTVSNNVVIYLLTHDLKVFHKPQIKEIKEFVKNARVFLEDSYLYVGSMFVLRKLEKNEFEFLSKEIKEAMDLCENADLIVKNDNDDAVFDYLVRDWFPGTDEETKTNALVSKNKISGPIEKLKSKLLLLLTPRFETLDEIKNRGITGYVYINPETSVLIKSIGEIIRSNYLYEHAANPMTEETITQYIFKTKGKK